MISAADFRAERHARVVIVGGGVIGASVAYQLTLAGERDVLLLEKSRLTDGCTWHAAGLVGQLRGKRNLTRLMQNSVAVFDRLSQQAPLDWKKVGSLRLAASPERWSEIRRAMTQAKSFGVECHALSAAEAQRLFPYIDTAGVEGAAFIPADGYIDPYALTQAYAAAARAAGARIEQGVTVTDVAVDGDRRRALGVATDRETVGCEILVNCAGLWAKRVGSLAGVSLAAGVVEHQYFLTEKKLDFAADLPTLRDPDKNFYLKPDTGAFAVGGWEDGTQGCWQGLPPWSFGRELLPENLGRLERFAAPAAERLPVLNEVGIQTIINGPIPVSADGEPIIGPVPELDNVFVACGFTAGIAASGGAGQALAQWIVNGDPGMDLWPLDSRRFGRLHAQSRYLQQRAIEAYGAYYKIHWPGGESQAGRGLRRSPLYHRLRRAGAVFGSKFGWERPNWFAGPGRAGLVESAPSFEQRPGWFRPVGAECRAIRERVALIDQSSFAKFELSGPGAYRALQRVAANRVPAEPGRVVYTQLLNDRGGIEADLTVARVAPQRFLLVTGSGFGVRDGHWLRSRIPHGHGEGVTLREVSGALSTVNLCGPRAREVLQAVSDSDLSGLGFFSAARVDLGLTEVLALRVGYVGELGWELYTAPEYAEHVYETLWAAGQDHGIANAGYYAVESCRLEKGYLYWSADIGPEVTPFAAGLGFCVARDKDFTGRAALFDRHGKPRPVGRRLATLSIGGFAPLYGGEPVLFNGNIVAATASCGYGHTLEKTIAYAYLPAGLSVERRFEIEAFGRRYPALRGPRCLYDPGGTRLQA